MEKEEIKIELAKMLARKNSLTDEDRKAIKELFNQQGLSGVNFASRCKSCYIDALTMLCIENHVSMSDAKTKSTKYEYMNKKPTIVIINGEGTKVYDENTDDESIEEYIKRFPTQTSYKPIKQ